MGKFRASLEETGKISYRRQGQAMLWMWSDFQAQLVRRAMEDEQITKKAKSFEDVLMKGHMTPRHAARDLVELFLSRQSSNV
jgi:putative protein kinase ArgK-like GTPase of G3E family